MSVEIYLGEPTVFQALFLDTDGSPLVVTSPNVTLFYFTDSGYRTVLLDGVAMVPVAPGEPGRYTYLYTVPQSLDDGAVLYAECRGTDPLLNVIVQQHTLTAVFRPSDQGLRVRFVR